MPEGSGDDLLGALADQWPSYLAYLVSFATIGAIWIKHTVITEYLDVATPSLVRLNLLLLMVVSFLPFPTRLLAEHIQEDEAERVATTVYGLNLLLASFLVAAMWRFAVRERLVRPDVSDAELAAVTAGIAPGLALYVVMIALGLFVPVLAVVGYLAVAVYIIVPFHAIRLRRPR